MSGSTAARVYRFSPLWVSGAAVVVLLVLWLPVSGASSFLGSALLITSVPFVLSGFVCALVAIPLLRRSLPSIGASPRPRMRMFIALAVVWLVSWLLGILVNGIVGLVLDRVLAADPTLTIESASSGFQLLPGFWAWSAPALLLYLLLSVPVVRGFGRRVGRPRARGAQTFST